ncbi:hypothetical protein PRIPAC_86947 [Pristionchus pacificus]|uniref:Endonuclease/exonuclease/phosphatase domain-containing protein n=1 Tax=Pristionchus pacificus TaxID=54126 RepID=A0A2A6CC46_PRIPA|nr:hypothetical protein PRIPAC_86947 [Pristionchus pacificus]|eukprot:PDM75782.1 hypothetical protein PRIPAC_40161 [Pristionchus pacificus]
MANESIAAPPSAPATGKKRRLLEEEELTMEDMKLMYLQLRATLDKQAAWNDRLEMEVSSLKAQLGALPPPTVVHNDETMGDSENPIVPPVSNTRPFPNQPLPKETTDPSPIPSDHDRSVVIARLPVDKSLSPLQQIHCDYDQVIALTELAGIPTLPVAVYRMPVGETNSSRMRLTKVVLPSKKHAQQLIKYASRVKRDKHFSEVYIRPSYENPEDRPKTPAAGRHANYRNPLTQRQSQPQNPRRVRTDSVFTNTRDIPNPSQDTRRNRMNSIRSQRAPLPSHSQFPPAPPPPPRPLLNPQYGYPQQSLIPPHSTMILPSSFAPHFPTPQFNRNSLSISALLANCRSVRNKLPYLSQILSQKHSIICLTETWLTSDFPNSLLLDTQDPYYNVFRRDRNSRGGGVAILVHSSISAIQIADETVKGSHELLAIDLDINGDLLRLVCVYRNPKASTLVKDPTRKDNLLDLVLCNSPGLISDTEIGPPFDISDHNVVKFKLTLAHSVPAFSLRRDYKKADYSLINSQLANVDWSSAFSILKHVDEMYDLLMKLIQKSIDTHVPWIKVNITHGKVPPHIERLISKRFLAWQEAIRLDDPVVTRKFEQLNRAFRKEMIRYHKTIEKKVIDSEDKNKFFRYMKRCSNKQRGVEGLKTSDGTVVMDDTGKANLLAAAFASVFTNDNGIVPTVDPPILGNYLDPTFLRHEICSHIERWKRSSCRTPENIDLGYIKKIAVPISEPLEIIFRHSFETGIVPSPWRHSIVTPVKKAPPKSDASTPLQNAIDTIAGWSEEWQLPLASHKCSSLHLGRANPKREYSIGTTKLEQKTEVKDLGFTIEKSLVFSKHCHSIAMKSKTACHTILRALRSHNIEVLMKTYSIYIRPILESASMVFNPYLPRDKKVLEKVQNYFTRRLYMRCHKATWENMPRAADRNAQLGITSLEKRREEIDLKTASNLLRGKYKISNQKPHHFCYYYTRNGINFTNNVSSSNYRQHSFFPRAARLVVKSGILNTSSSE